MIDSSPRPQWAPRVSRYKIWQLYQSDAKGLQDEELVDDVGWALLARVQDCLVVNEAHYRGRVMCPRCGTIIERKHNLREHHPEETLICPAGDWSTTWEDYHKSYRNKHLSSPGLETFFREFAEQFPRAKTYREKMVLIDALLHRYHWELEFEQPYAPGASTLIGGGREEILAFLNQLTYGEGSTPGLTETKTRWLQKLNGVMDVKELTARHPWREGRSVGE